MGIDQAGYERIRSQIASSARTSEAAQLRGSALIESAIRRQRPPTVVVNNRVGLVMSVTEFRTKVQIQKQINQYVRFGDNF
jgi:hypothetical protein